MSPNLFHNRFFTRVFLGETVSQLGTGLAYIAVMAKFLELTGNTQGWAFILALKAVPFLLFGWIAGYIADRCNPRWVLLIVHLIQFLIYLGIAFCHHIDLFCTLVFLSSTFDAFSIPAYKSLITRLLDKGLLLGANSLEETVRSTVAIMGIACSGIIIGWAGLQACFLVDAATFGIAALNLACMRHLPLTAREPSALTSSQKPWKTLRQELGRGFLLLRDQKGIRYPIFISLFLCMLVGFEMPMFLPFAVEKGWNGPLATGYLYACASLGSLLTALILLNRKKSPIRHLWPVSLVIMMDGCILLGIVLSPKLAIALCIALGLGTTETLFRTYSVTEIQQTVTPDTVGRVFSALAAVQEPVKILSMVLSGVVVGLISARNGLLLAVGLELLIGLLTLSFYWLGQNQQNKM
jgi:DHA3 family macrolide efflux protein-like MFS transporter